MSHSIPKLKFSEPRHNLPGRKGVATAEDRFTIAFAKAYREQVLSLHSGSIKNTLALAREIPANGYGIADLIAVAYSSVESSCLDVESFADLVKPTTRAFECKLADWRSGLSQASRYRYFSHQAVFVCPPVICAKAISVIDTFRAIKVGLWSFDVVTKRIAVYHSPRPSRPISRRYYLECLEKVQRATKGSLPIL